MENVALLVVDVQEGLVALHPYEEEQVINNIKTLISFCRDQEIEVIYARHDSGVGRRLERGTPAWQIHEPVAPAPTERVFDKQFNSAFKETGLDDYLRQKAVETLVLVGIQTEYCVDSTCKTAFEFGYKVIIPEQTTTTYDNGPISAKDVCELYTERIWHNRFATVMPVITVLETLQS